MKDNKNELKRFNLCLTCRKKRCRKSQFCTCTRWAHHRGQFWWLALHLALNSSVKPLIYWALSIVSRNLWMWVQNLNLNQTPTFYCPKIRLFHLNFEKKNSKIFLINFLQILQLNPQHTIPFLEDNGVQIADSHAICAYLSEKYGKTDSLYPKDLAKRSQVDARLHFDSGHLFARLRFLFEPILYYKAFDLPEERIKYVYTALDILERFLANTPYVCGNELTIADLCIVATAASLTEIIPLDPAKHTKIIQWIERLSKLPYYEEFNGIGARSLQVAVRDLIKKNSETKWNSPFCS